MMYHNDSPMPLEVRGGMCDGEKLMIPRSRARRGDILAVPRNAPVRDIASGAYMDEPAYVHVDIYRVVHNGSLLYLEHVEDRLLPVDARERSLAA
jgi:hypothetical protein